MNVLKRKKNKKGMTSIEIVLSVIIVILIVSGFVDLTGILRRSNAVSMNTSYVSRVVGNQGGIQTRKINNFNGRYIPSSELYGNVKRSMNSSGIPDDEWEVKVYGIKLTPNTNIPVFDYGTRIPVEVTVNYKWGLTDNFIPGNLEGVHESKSTVSTTHKVRDGGFTQN